MASRKAVNGPVDPKIVYASAAAAVTGLVLWLLGTYVFTGPDGVPAPLAAFIVFFAPGVVAIVSGYVKRTPLHILKGRANAAVVEATATGADPS